MFDHEFVLGGWDFHFHVSSTTRGVDAASARLPSWEESFLTVWKQERIV